MTQLRPTPLIDTLLHEAERRIEEDRKREEEEQEQEIEELEQRAEATKQMIGEIADIIKRRELEGQSSENYAFLLPSYPVKVRK